MKFPIPALIIACLLGADLQAQSVADVARRERARRSAGTPETRVYTGVPQDASSRISVPSAVPLEAESETDAVRPESVSDETSNRAQAETETLSDPAEIESAPPNSTEELLGEIAEQQAIVQGLDDRRVRALLEVNRLRGTYQVPLSSQRDLRQVQVELEAAQEELSEAATALTAAREVMVGLEAALERLSPPSR